MKWRGQLVSHNINKKTKQKIELLKNISKNAEREGVNSSSGIEDKLDQIEDYIPSLFFPLNERNLPAGFHKEFSDALTEARASKSLAYEYIATLINLQEELYEGVRSISKDWFAIDQQFKSLMSYEKYLYRSVGPTMSVVPVSFFKSKENPLLSSFGSCYVTLNNQASLPISSVRSYPIRKTTIKSYEEKDLDSLNSHVQNGSFVFRATERIENEDIEFEIELEQEEQVNRIKIPCSLPLPVHIDFIELLDSTKRATKVFYRKDLESLVFKVPNCLELIFSKVPVKYIKIHFFKQLNTQKIGLVSKRELTETEANLVPLFAKNIEQLNARGQVNKKELKTLLHDSFASFQQAFEKQKASKIDAWCGIFGAIVEPSLTSFERSGSYSTQVYSGKDVKASSVRANGSLMSYQTNSIDLNSPVSNEKVANTFVAFKIIKSNLDENQDLLSRVAAFHPLSRPFNQTCTELITAQDKKDRQSEYSLELQEYNLNMKAKDSSSVSLFVPSASGNQPASGHVEQNLQTGKTVVKTSNYLQEDIVAQYTLKAPQSPVLSEIGEQYPYYLSPTGSVVYENQSLKVDNCKIHLNLEMHRVKFDEHLTPLIDNATVILGHKPNKGSAI